MEDFPICIKSIIKSNNLMFNLDKNIYPKRFFDQSTTSTAFLTKFCSPILRIFYFIVGVTLLILPLMFK
jgi:hypothetical protein